MKVGFTGTRAGMTDGQREVVSNLLMVHNVTFAVHGKCIGADTDFHGLVGAHSDLTWIKIRPGPIKEMQGNCVGHEELPPEPHFKRNRAIVDDADLMFATPATTFETSGGTWYTINYTKKVKKPLIIIWPEPIGFDLFESPIWTTAYNMENLHESH